MARASIFSPNFVSGLPVFKRVLDARLRLLGREQLHEAFALELEEPLLVHQAAGLDVAAAHALRRSCWLTR